MGGNPRQHCSKSLSGAGIAAGHAATDQRRDRSTDWIFSPDFEISLPNGVTKKDLWRFLILFLAYSPGVFILTEISCSPSHLYSICRRDFSIWPGYYEKMRTSCFVRRTPLLAIKGQRSFASRFPEICLDYSGIFSLLPQSFLPIA